ncbi:MAG: uL15m family ribosomal protein [Candidatus Aenigmatarchaeota archaeon]
MGKKKKHRGSGTHGGGSKKKRRGAGNRGGRGKGGGKHRKIKYQKEKKVEKGFKRPGAVKDSKRGINIKELEGRLKEFIEIGACEKEDGVYKINLKEAGYDKLLGSGKITEKLEVEAEDFSKKAKEKLEERGGSVIELS